MNYQQALCAAMSGLFVRRSAWPRFTGIRGETDEQGSTRLIYTSLSSPGRSFRPSVIDLAADDWVVLE